ncbi:hypothetical protein J2T28_001973 [Kerstersia gyiorum]|nr:hypothetical protein [Kerstersia gyiorum]
MDMAGAGTAGGKRLQGLVMPWGRGDALPAVAMQNAGRAAGMRGGGSVADGEALARVGRVFQFIDQCDGEILE